MKVANFLNLIIKIFKSHGFEINSTSNYSQYVLATKDNINLSIGFTKPNEQANVTKIKNFFRSAKKDSADRLIYILPQAYPKNIERFADDRNIQLWDRERFEREIGRAVVTDLDRPSTEEYSDDLGEILSIGSEEEDIVSADKASSEPGTADEIIPIMVPVVPLYDEEGETATADKAGGELGATKYDAETERMVAQTPEIKEYRIIKPMVSKDNASSMASKIVKGFRFNLELIPYYIFDYNCKFELENQEDAEEYGMLGINGLTSNVEDWTKYGETVKNLDEPHTKLEVKFPYEKALTIAKQAVIELNTKMIETKEEFESTVIFEKKKLKPKTDAISITSKGIHYLPVWCIEGSNGLMIIDATSGNIIREDMFKSSNFQNMDATNQESEIEG